MAATVSPELGQAGADLGQGGPHGRPDLARVVLDPAGPGEVLGELAIGHVGHPGPVVDDQGADAGGAGIDGDDLGHAGSTLTVRGHVGAVTRGRVRPSRANHRERPVTCTDGARIWLTRA